MMPGVGFIGGKLSVIGGYSWPGGVSLIEEWDDNNEEFVRSTKTIKYPRLVVTFLTSKPIRKVTFLFGLGTIMER